MESKREAIRAVRSGSPGRRMYSASSPGPSPMWYCRSPAGIAIRRSDGVSTRLSAFGKTSSSLMWLLRWRETRPRIVPPSHERQAEWIVLGPRSAERGGAAVGGGPAALRAGPRSVASRPAIRVARRRCDCSRRSEGHGHRGGRDREQRAEPGGAGIDRQRRRRAPATGSSRRWPRRATLADGRSRRRVGVAADGTGAARPGRPPGRCRPGRRRRRPARRPSPRPARSR